MSETQFFDFLLVQMMFSLKYKKKSCFKTSNAHFHDENLGNHIMEFHKKVKLKCIQHCQSECLSAISSEYMASSYSNNGCIHGVNEAIDISDGQHIPCSHQSYTQLLQSMWLCFQLLDTHAHHVPDTDMFYGIQVWRLCWITSLGLISWFSKNCVTTLARWG